MTKPTTTVLTDETLRELWMIKDETATRFRNAADYFKHLGLATSAKTAIAPRTLKTKLAPTSTSSTTRSRRA
jgi:hypothetical protein